MRKYTAIVIACMIVGTLLFAAGVVLLALLPDSIPARACGIIALVLGSVTAVLGYVVSELCIPHAPSDKFRTPHGKALLTLLISGGFMLVCALLCFIAFPEETRRMYLTVGIILAALGVAAIAAGIAVYAVGQKKRSRRGKSDKREKK